MKPNKRIQEMKNHTLINEFSKQMIAYGGQLYGDNQTQSLPRYSKKQISMLRNELFRRLTPLESNSKIQEVI